MEALRRAHRSSGVRAWRGRSVVNKSKWSEEDLRREALETLAGVFNKNAATVRGWKVQQQTFPEQYEDGKYVVLRVVMWWLWKKAPKDIARWMYEKLKQRFGDAGAVAGGDADVMEHVAKPEVDEYTTQKQLLDLRIRSFDVDKKLGDALSAKDLSPWLMDMANEIRKVLEDVQKATGFQVRDRISELFERKLAELDVMSGDGSESDDLD